MQPQSGSLGIGSTLVSINVLARCQAHLVLGWLTICGVVFAPSCYLIYHVWQLSLAMPVGRWNEFHQRL